MAEDTVDVPPWSADGLIFVDGEELVPEWGISEACGRLRRLKSGIASR
jgi:hypothetical protein